MEHEERLIAVGGAIKALDDNGRVGGYLVVFGDENTRDLQGEYFTPDTDLSLDWYDRRPALYHHGLDDTLKSARVGTIDVMKVDDTGVWAEAQLEMHDEYVRKVKELVARGVLSWSSGSVPHLVETEAGKIKRWPIVEGSLTPTPAEPRGTNIMPLKAYLELVTPAAAEGEPEAAIEPETVKEPPLANKADGVELTIEVEPTEPETNTMNMEQIIMAVLQAVIGQGINLSEEQQAAIVQQVMAAQPPEAVAAVVTDEQKASELAAQLAPVVAKAANDYVAALQAREAALKGAINGAVQAQLKPAAKSNGYSAGAITEVRDARFDYLKAEDLVFGANMLLAANKPVSEELLRAAASKVIKAADNGHKAYGTAAVKAALPARKADEIVATNLTNYGSYWVGVAYENQLWEAVHETPIYQQITARGIMNVEIPQGASSVYIPTEGTDPTWYTMPELNDLTTDEFPPVAAKTSTPTATRQQLTVANIGARVLFTDNMEDDALFPLLPHYRSRMELTAQEQIEYVILNGDTETGGTGNINSVDGAPSVDSKGRGPSYLAFDGLLKLPLVTTAALRRDGGTFDETDFLETWKLLPAAQQVNMERLMFVVDPYTYMAALNITAFKTRDVFSLATVENGTLSRVFGIDVVRSGQMAKANTAGKISTTPGNNTKGRILLVRPDQWAIGFKRQVRTETARDIDAQATIIVSTLRFGMVYRSATGGAAVSYNLTV